MQLLDAAINPFLAVMAVAYAVLAVRVARTEVRHGNSLTSVFLVLIGGMLAGSAFSYNAETATLYNIGRALSYTSAGFLPLAFYAIYREYTVGAPSPVLIAILALIPTLSAGIALSNSMHNMLWVVTETATGIRFSPMTSHVYYNFVYAPFTYGLFAFSAIALAARLPTIAAANRRPIAWMMVCAIVPYCVSISNTFLGVGDPDFPFTSTTLGLMWPFFAYFFIKLRVHEFSPLAYQTLFDHVRDPIFVVDNEQRIICANKAAQELLRGDEAGLIGRKLWEDFPEARAILEQARELDLTQTLRIDTETVYEVNVAPLSGPKGQNLGMVVVCRDVTERRKALSKLAESEHLIRTLIETSSNGILRFSRDENDPERRFRCVFANRAAENLNGNASSGTLVGMPLEKLDFLRPDKLSRHFSDPVPAKSQISFEVSADDYESVAPTDGWLRIIGEPVGSDFSVTLIDITQRKRNEHKMMADALRDPLTGVLNRRGFEQAGETAIRQSSVGAVLYLDLNQFKSINDRFGHQAGDALLKAFGHRLEFCLRPEDVLGRLGGDEFAIVLPGVGVEDTKHIAGRLVQAASEAYIIQGQEIKCTASVGIALLPKHGEELWHLLSVADQAMYRAKTISVDDAANDRAAYVEAAMAS